jgi:molybdenum cofactor biosynthesis enzyme MoaA
LVVTNRRCNQNCRFCTERSPVDDPASIQRAAVERRVEQARADGADELVLTGGEPTLRRDLASIVASAKRSGMKRVVLETNGTLLEDTTIASLCAAGVDVFRVHVPAWGAALNAITRDDNAATALLRALSGLARMSVAFEVATPVVRSNLADVASIPDGLISALGEASSLRLMRVSVPTHAPEPDELVSFAEAVDAIAAIDAAARRVGLATKLAPGSAPPPCVFPKRTRPTHLWSLTGQVAPRSDRVRVAACDSCLVREHCAGLDAAQIARFGAPSLEPVAEERARRRLALIATVEEQIAREFRTLDSARDPSGGFVEEEIIRVNFHCNQACGFCFVSTHLPPPGHATVLAAIEGAVSRGAKVVLSGGEPTLNARLSEYVRLGSRAGTLPLQLQTNAVRLDDDALVRTLVDAGLREAFVSLHAGTADVSDALTGAPGTFDRTLAGIDNLVRAGVDVTTNYVISEPNAAEFPRYVALVAERWPTSSINVSFVAPSTDVVPRELVPRYSAVLPHLAEGLRLAETAGVTVRGFESMCGVPLCLVPEEMRRHLDFADITDGADGGEFVQPTPCEKCSARTRCFGVRRGYAELHGIAELRPLP